MTTTKSGSPANATWDVASVPGYRTLFQGLGQGEHFSRVIVQHSMKPEQWCIIKIPKPVRADGTRTGVGEKLKITFGEIAEKSPDLPQAGFSAGTKEIYPSRRRQLTAQVLWHQGGGFELRIPAEKHHAVFWAQPRKLPLLCTFPRPGADTPAIVMDDQRSQIPHELKVDNVSLEIKFPENKLPSIEVDFVVSGTPSNQWRAIETRELMMMTTLPGSEAEIRNDQLKWRLRHATPVLDQAYLEVRESETEINQPQPIELSDTTRTEDAAVLEIGPVGSTAASNWLHRGSPSASNLVKFQLFTPTGTHPKLTIQLANGKDVSFSRRHDLVPPGNEPTVESAGLTQGLKVVVTTSNSAQLPSFDVSFATDNPDAEIRREGQPLLTAPTLDATHSLVTMDGKGIVRGEPVEAITRFRTPDTASDQLRLTASFHQAGLQLDLIGIEQGAFDQTFHRWGQQWMLHDGKGSWALLNGFAMYPVSLTLSSLTEAEIDVVLAPVGLVNRQLLQNPSTVVRTKVSIQNSLLTIDSYDGRFQWRFELGETPVDSSMRLVGISGTIKKASGQPPAVTIEELVIRTDIGIIRLPGLSVTAELDPTPGSEKITIPATSVRILSGPNQFGPLVSLATFSIRSANNTPALVDGTISWERSPALATGITYALTYSAGQATPWQLQVRLPDAGIGGNAVVTISYALAPSRVDSGHFLFAAKIDLRSLPVLTGTLFELKSSSGILTAQFNRDLQLTDFGGDLLFVFASSGSTDSVPGRLLGRLSASERDTPVLECSGAITIQNGIAWEHGPTSQSITHVATFFFDYAIQPLLCLLQGRHVGDPMTFACVVRHRMIHNNKVRAEWHSPQTARWMRLADYKAIYRPGGAVLDEAADELAVLESGAVIWLENEPAEQIIPRAEGRGVDLEADHNELAVRIRDAEEINVDRPGYVIRLPFAAVHGIASPIHRIKIKGVAGLPTSSRGAQHQPLFFAPQRRASQVAYLFRSARASHVDSDSLQGLLRPLDSRQLLSTPAFPAGDPNKSTVHLPDQLDDLMVVVTFPAEAPLHRAATIVRRYPLEKQSDIRKWWNLHGQVLSGASLVQTMCHVEDLPPADALKPPFAQLIAVRGGKFYPLAKETFEAATPTEQDLQDWANEILATQPPGTVSFLLRDYVSFRAIPSGYERRREDLPDTWDFSGANAATPIDPRTRIPGPPLGKPALDLSLKPERLEALSRRTLFAVQADIPVTELTDRPVVAATHFRLASIHDDAQAKGTMRQATTSTTRAGSNQSTEHQPQLSWTQWDSVDFAASRDQHYPALDSSALTNLPAASPASEHVTLMPPLMHAVTWASRPGETTTTQWDYEELIEDDAGVLSRKGLPCTVDLRRPRAQSGRHESVRLLEHRYKEASREVFGGRLYYINNDLEQTLGISPPPKPASVNAVLSNRETFFVSNNRDVASQEPALIFTQPGQATPAMLEAIQLSLFADPAFDPDAIPNPPDPDVRTEMYLFLAAAGNDPPDDYPDNGEPTKPRVVILRKIPPLTDSFWVPHPTTPSPMCFAALIENLHELAKPLLEQLSTSDTKLEILMFRYEHDPNDSKFVRPQEPVFALTMIFLDPSAAFLLPKMSVTLLGVQSSGDAHVAGYGRLNANNFTLPTSAIDTSNEVTIRWVRHARLTALDRRGAEQLDVVVYGAGGDLIPTRP